MQIYVDRKTDLGSQISLWPTNIVLPILYMLIHFYIANGV
jgi:hypothetical protein